MDTGPVVIDVMETASAVGGQLFTCNETKNNGTSSTTRGAAGLHPPLEYLAFRIVVDIYFITLLCVVGLVGNALSLAVLCHDREHSNNTTTWLLQVRHCI